MKLQELSTGAYVIVLPVQLVRAKGWEKGDELKVEIDKDGNFLIKKVGGK